MKRKRAPFVPFKYKKIKTTSTTRQSSYVKLYLVCSIINFSCLHVYMPLCLCAFIPSCQHISMSLCLHDVMSSCFPVCMSSLHQVIMSTCQHNISPLSLTLTRTNKHLRMTNRNASQTIIDIIDNNA